MIYGQLAKKMSYRAETVSESDAIIKFLKNEVDQYNNTFITESYMMDSDERMVLEAKLEVLNEAVTGVIIAAIIAAVGALIALIVKFISVLKDGHEKLSKKVDEKTKKDEEKSDKDEKSEKKESGDKKEDNAGNKEQQSNSIHKPSETKAEEPNQQQSKSEEKKTTWGSLSSDEKKKVKSKLFSGKIKGISMLDFSQVINCTSIKEINGVAKDLISAFISGSKEDLNFGHDIADRLTFMDKEDFADLDTDEVEALKGKNINKIPDSFINKVCRVIIIEKAYKSEISKYYETNVAQALIELYNNHLEPDDKIFENTDKYRSIIGNQFKQSMNKIKNLQSDLQTLKSYLESIKDKVQQKAHTDINASNQKKKDKAKNKNKVDAIIQDIGNFIKTVIAKLGNAISGWKWIEQTRSASILKIATIVDFGSYLND
jgi:hypothetical protein